jgi:alpha-ketoglutarate-dependent taurine dioxygenase
MDSGLVASHQIVRTHQRRGAVPYLSTAASQPRLSVCRRNIATHRSSNCSYTATCEKAEHIARHGWAENDVVIWISRRRMHQALPFQQELVRHMHLTTIKGDQPCLVPVDSCL